MGDNTKEPTYTGFHKYPGTIATVITILITVVFVGALYMEASHHEEGDAGEEQGEEIKAEDEAATPAQ